MRKLLMGLVVLGFSMTPTFAQWSTEASAPVKADQEVHLEFDFSSMIRVHHWDQQEAKAVLTVEEKENYPTPDFTIDVSGSTSVVSLYMDKQQFERYWEKIGPQGDCRCNYSSPKMEVEVWVPRGVSITVKSISSDIETTFEGGQLKLETISGDVDVKLPASQNLSLKASTISGDIYSDLSFDYLDDGKGLRQMVGMKLDAKLNEGGKLLSLKSISGDILLRKL